MIADDFHTGKSWDQEIEIMEDLGQVGATDQPALIDPFNFCSAMWNSSTDLIKGKQSVVSGSVEGRGVGHDTAPAYKLNADYHLEEGVEDVRRSRSESPKLRRCLQRYFVKLCDSGKLQ